MLSTLYPTSLQPMAAPAQTPRFAKAGGVTPSAFGASNPDLFVRNVLFGAVKKLSAKDVAALIDAIKNQTALDADLEFRYEQVVEQKRQELLDAVEPKPVATPGLASKLLGKKQETPKFGARPVMPKDLPPAPPKPAGLDTSQIKKDALAGRLDVTLKSKDPKTLVVDKQENALADESQSKIQDKAGKTLEAGILASYPVKWPPEKCVRDLLQNFSDSHGGTLDGVRITVNKLATGEYQVKIQGQAEYNHLLLEDLGATSKRGNQRVAGGFGEGAKILSLVMLREGLAENLEFSSRNWTYRFMLDTSNKTAPLMRRFGLVPDQPGNSVQFTTKNTQFISQLIEGLNYFSHTSNPDFIAPSYENDRGGFTYLGLNQRGNLYVAGQRVEYRDPIHQQDHWQGGLEGLSVWSKEKNEFWDRDRSSLDFEKVYKRLERIVAGMSNQDITDTLRLLKDAWDPENIRHSLSGKRSIVKSEYRKTATSQLLRLLLARANERGLRIEFPETWISLSDRERRRMGHTRYLKLKAEGYEFFNESFRELGMGTGLQFSPVDYAGYGAKAGRIIATPFKPFWYVGAGVAGGVAGGAVLTAKGVGAATKASARGARATKNAFSEINWPRPHLPKALAEKLEARSAARDVEKQKEKAAKAEKKKLKLEAKKKELAEKEKIRAAKQAKKEKIRAAKQAEKDKIRAEKQNSRAEKRAARYEKLAQRAEANRAVWSRWRLKHTKKLKPIATDVQKVEKPVFVRKAVPPVTEQKVRLKILQEAVALLGEDQFPSGEYEDRSALLNLKLYDIRNTRRLAQKDRPNRSHNRREIWLEKFVLYYDFDRALTYYLKELNYKYGYAYGPQLNHDAYARAMKSSFQNMLRALNDSSPEGQERYIQLAILRDLWERSIASEPPVPKQLPPLNFDPTRPLPGAGNFRPS